jgi:hypothetical protein
MPKNQRRNGGNSADSFTDNNLWQQRIYYAQLYAEK